MMKTQMKTRKGWGGTPFIRSSRAPRNVSSSPTLRLSSPRRMEKKKRKKKTRLKLSFPPA